MGFCLEEDNTTVLHVICGQDGKWYTDTTNCEMGMPCVNGACAECADSDGKLFEEKGYVIGIDNTGSVYVKEDSCLETKTLDYRSDFTCENTFWKASYEACPEGQKCIEEIVDGQAQLLCVPGVIPICDDSDGADNFSEKGYVEGIAKDGDKFYHPDFCLETTSGDTIIDFVCKKGYPELRYFWCKPDEICQETMNTINDVVQTTLSCVPSPYEMTCADSDGPEDFMNKGYVQGIDNHGEPYVSNDACVGNGLVSAIFDYWCDGNVPTVSSYVCPENMFCTKINPQEGGGTLLHCVKACIDTDVENNPAIPGTVFDFNNVPYPDVCEGSILYQYACTVETGEKVEAGITTCPDGCDQGKCK